MAVSVGLDSGIPLQTFNVSGDLTAVGPRWERWIRAFNLFADGRGVDDKKQRKALMLSTAGLAVQDIFFTLPQGAADDYDGAVKVLNEHFTKRINYSFERFQFKSMRQAEDESIDQFYTRLRMKAENCNFDAAKDEFIKDQIISGCLSDQLRSVCLEKDHKLTEILDLARSKEASKTFSKMMKINDKSSVVGDKPETVNKVYGKKKKGRNAQSKGMTSQNHSRDVKPGSCYRCGLMGHFSKDKSCPAREKTCNKCQKKGHFATVCKTKMSKKKEAVNFTHTDGDKGSDSDEYAFSVRNWIPGDDTDDMISVTIGGVPVSVLVDSGASTNIVDLEMWEKLKQQKIQCTSKKCDKQLFAYGSKEPLKTQGSFSATVKVGNSQEEAEFIVI